MDSVRTEVLRVIIEAQDRATRAFRDAGLQAEVMGQRIERTSGVWGRSVDRMGAGLHTLGIGMIAAGATAGVLIDKSVKAAMDFQSVTQALANNTNMGTAGLNEMRSASMALAAQTGQDSLDIAKGYMYISNHMYAGVAALNILTAATKNAAATNGVASENALVLSNILKESNVSMADLANNTDLATRYMDVLHNAVANSNFTMKDFVEGGKAAFATAGSLNIPIQDTAAQLATLSFAYKSSAQAALNWSGAMRSMIHPTAGALKNMSGVEAITGIPLLEDMKRMQEQAAGSINDPQAQARFLADIRRATGGDLNKVLSMFPRASYGMAIENMIRSGRYDMLQHTTTLTTAARNGQMLPGMTGTNEAFLKQQETLAAKLKDTEQAFHNIEITIGTAFIPVLDRMMGIIGPLVKQFGEWVNTHQELTKNILLVTTALGAVAAAAMGVGFVLGPLISLLGLVASPIGLIAAAAFALYEAWQHDFGGIREITAQAWSAIQPALHQIGDAVGKVVDAFKMGGLGAAATVAVQQAQALLGRLGNWIDSTGVPYLRAHLAGWVQAYWAWVKDVDNKLFSELGALLGKIGAWLDSTGVPYLKKNIGPWATAFSEWVVKAGGDLLGLAGHQLDLFVAYMKGPAGQKILAETGRWAGDFANWVIQAGGDLLGAAGHQIDLFVAYMRGPAGQQILVEVGRWAISFDNWVIDAGEKLLQNTMTAIGNLVSYLAGAAYTELVKEMNDIEAAMEAPFRNLGSWFTTMGKNIVQGLINGIESMAGNLASAVTNKIVNVVKDIPGVSWIMKSPSMLFFQYGQNVGRGLINGLASMQDPVAAATGTMVKGATDAADYWVKGYTRRDGRVVAGHWADRPGDAAREAAGLAPIGTSAAKSAVDAADYWVKAYVRRNGTVVPGHWADRPGDAARERAGLAPLGRAGTSGPAGSYNAVNGDITDVMAGTFKNALVRAMYDINQGTATKADAQALTRKAASEQAAAIADAARAANYMHRATYQTGQRERNDVRLAEKFSAAEAKAVFLAGGYASAALVAANQAGYTDALAQGVLQWSRSTGNSLNSAAGRAYARAAYDKAMGINESVGSEGPIGGAYSPASGGAGLGGAAGASGGGVVYNITVNVQEGAVEVGGAASPGDQSKAHALGEAAAAAIRAMVMSQFKSVPGARGSLPGAM